MFFHSLITLLLNFKHLLIVVYGHYQAMTNNRLIIQQFIPTLYFNSAYYVQKKIAVLVIYC